MKSLLTLALMLSLSPAHAVSEQGAKNAVFFLSTATLTTDSFYVGTGNSRALGGSVLGSIVISSATAGGAMFEVWDSSNVTLATTGRTKLANVACAAIGAFPFMVEAQYGLTIISKGCAATLLYLTHK